MGSILMPYLERRSRNQERHCQPEWLHRSAFCPVCSIFIKTIRTAYQFVEHASIEYIYVLSSK
jgi:hypothetical protein